MGYYENKNELKKMIEEWCYLPAEERPPWDDLVAEAFNKFSFADLTCRKTLKNMSAKKLSIDENGKLVKHG